ncbi:MAG: transcriptional repressor [Patescibacteria group bacterium]|jgi:Fe2+ or Zn2+ uptake regulation protein
MDKNSKITRLTAQKKAILGCVRDFWPIHPSSQMVYQRVKKSVPSISLGTVYRNLNSLREGGYIEEIVIHNEPSRYDSHVDAHLHFKCDECGELYDIDNPSLLKSHTKRLKDQGFVVQRSSIMFQGLCQKCYKKSDQISQSECVAHGKIEPHVHKNNSSCKICGFQEECSYHPNK